MMERELHRGTGLLWIETINSNPNGNPDQDSEPRQRSDERGEISPVSFKHKVRELVAYKEGPIWKEISAELGIEPSEMGHYDILEQKETKRSEVKRLSSQEFLDRYWDARVFGSTFLEGKIKDELLQLIIPRLGRLSIPAWCSLGWDSRFLPLKSSASPQRRFCRQRRGRERAWRLWHSASCPMGCISCHFL